MQFVTKSPRKFRRASARSPKRQQAPGRVYPHDEAAVARAFNHLDRAIVVIEPPALDRPNQPTGIVIDIHDSLPCRRIALRALVALLLYEAHVLWFLMGGIWLLGFGLLRRWPVRAFTHHLAALVPGLLLGALWYPTMMASRSLFRTRAFWITTPWQRLYPPRLCETLMGGARKRTKPGICVIQSSSLASRYPRPCG
jgi:hypothetical protein